MSLRLPSSAPCDLTVVLFVKGRGTDPAGYRPARDESQWWNRRDALVRCVAALLFGPISLAAPPWRATARRRRPRRELVFIHDEDWSRLHMEYDDGHCGADDRRQRFVPTERTILSLWKRAAAAASANDSGSGETTVEADGLTCRLVGCHRSRVVGDQSKNNVAFSSSPPGMHDSNKRQILEHMQAVCSMDFLRQEKLNSSPAAVLRKTNKKALMRAWNRWRQKEEKRKGQKSSATGCERQRTVLKSVLTAVLRTDNGLGRVVAGILHESAERELPCWTMGADDSQEEEERCRDSDDDDNASLMRVCLFLGAVRDMHQWERSCLRHTCRQENVPLVGMRIGPVAEFTSKILTVVAFHHSQDRLGPAFLQLLADDEKSEPAALPPEGWKKGIRKRSRPTKGCTSGGHSFVSSTARVSTLHTVCLVPMNADEVSLDLDKRQGNRLLWCLVRCTVAALWRSRVASQGDKQQRQPAQNQYGGTSGGDHGAGYGDGGLRNRLTWVFADGKVLTVRQEDLVHQMAERHQAAPSEYQILSALRDGLRSAGVEREQVHDRRNGRVTTKKIMSWERVAAELAEELLTVGCDPTGSATADDPAPRFCVLHLNRAAETDQEADQCLGRRFYHCMAAHINGDDQNRHFEDDRIDQSVVVLLPVGSSPLSSFEVAEAAAAAVHPGEAAILGALRKRGVPVHRKTIIPSPLPASLSFSCQDLEAASITLLQHFCYQNVLGLMLGREPPPGRSHRTDVPAPAKCRR